MMSSLIAALLLQAAAATPAPVCAAPVAPPAGLEAWSAVPTSGPALNVGAPTSLDLRPVADMSFGVAPERAPAPGTFAGAYPLTITKGGTYRVALSAGAWIDLVDQDRKALKTVAHTEGAACSGIRKVVDFAIAPGNYTLQLSSAKAAPMKILIATK